MTGVRKPEKYAFMTRDEYLSKSAIASNYKSLKNVLDVKYHAQLDALVKHSLYYGARLYGHTRDEQKIMLDDDE